jgi:hypothetical protein
MKADSSLSYLTVPASFGYASGMVVAPSISFPSPLIQPPSGIVWEIAGPNLRFSWPGVTEIPCARVSAEISPGVWDVVESCVAPVGGIITVPAPTAPTNYRIEVLTPGGWSPPAYVSVNTEGPTFKITPHQVSGQFGQFLSQSFQIVYSDGFPLPGSAVVEWLSVSYPSGWPRFFSFHTDEGNLRGVPTNGPGVSVPFSGILSVTARITFSPTQNAFVTFPVEVNIANTYQDPSYYVTPFDFTVIRGQGCFGDSTLYGDCSIPLTLYKDGVSINNRFRADWLWGGPVEWFSTSSNFGASLEYLWGVGYLNTLRPQVPPNSFWSEGEVHYAFVVHELYVYGCPVFPMRIGFLVNFFGS